MTEQDAKRKWQEDPEASTIFAEAKSKTDADHPPLFCYAVSPSALKPLFDVAATVGASRLILGAPKRSALINLLRRQRHPRSFKLASRRIDLLVYALTPVPVCNREKFPVTALTCAIKTA